jgi:hypothetical protein
MIGTKPHEMATPGNVAVVDTTLVPMVVTTETEEAKDVEIKDKDEDTVETVVNGGKNLDQLLLLHLPLKHHPYPPRPLT